MLEPVCDEADDEPKELCREEDPVVEAVPLDKEVVGVTALASEVEETVPELEVPVADEVDWMLD